MFSNSNDCPYMNCPFWEQNQEAFFPQQMPSLPGPNMLQPTVPTEPTPGMPGQNMPQQFYPTEPMFPTDEGEQLLEMPENQLNQRRNTPTDPPPILSNNPEVTNITLFKELTGYPNYGNPSRNADILYTGNRGIWTFEYPPFLLLPMAVRARLVIRGALDDHSNVPTNRYSARITLNGTVIHNGRIPLEHGTPAGGMFNNWRELTFNVSNFRRSNRLVIDNTSTAGPDDWIAFDWMEIRFTQR